MSLQNNGIFFLQKSLLFPDTYVPVHGDKGFISFISYNGHDLYGYTQGKIYKKLTRELYTPLIDLFGQPDIFRLNEHETELLEAQFKVGNTDCVEYLIKNLELLQVNNLTGSTSYTVDFDIDIRSLNDIFKLKRSEISMEYSTTLLGENVVATNGISAILGGDFQNYSLSLSDETPSKVKVDVEKLLGALAYDINTFQSQLYHASIYIQNFDLLAVLNLTVDENFDLKTYKEEPDYSETEIECNLYNQDISVTLEEILPINITSYTETAYAGTKTLLTIEGTNLLASSVAATEVWFTNAENADIFQWVKPYSGDYVSRTDVKIEVYVPSYALDVVFGTNQNKEYAGTGKIKVVHDVFNGVATEESGEKNITILYAVRNKYYQFGSGGSQAQPVMFTNDNGTTGYVVAYTQAFKDAENNGFYFKDAFEPDKLLVIK